MRAVNVDDVVAGAVAIGLQLDTAVVALADGVVDGGPFVSPAASTTRCPAAGTPLTFFFQCGTPPLNLSSFSSLFCGHPPCGNRTRCAYSSSFVPRSSHLAHAWQPRGPRLVFRGTRSEPSLSAGMFRSARLTSSSPVALVVVVQLRNVLALIRVVLQDPCSEILIRDTSPCSWSRSHAQSTA